jgi:hypothetical protein
MKQIKLFGIFFSIVIIFTLASCGGGGGGGDTPTPPPPTKAIMKIATTGSPSASPIGIVQARLNLPSGVSVKATQNITDSGVVTASGNATATPGSLIESGIYSSGSVTVTIANTSGFAVGEFATVNCDIAAGSFPKASDFSITNLDARDLNGNVISGLTPTFAATIN